MKTPFPGMDPWLEEPSLWPDVHNRLIASIADAIVPWVAPRYIVAVEQYAYRVDADEVALVGRPDIVVAKETQMAYTVDAPPGVAILEVDLPSTEEIHLSYLSLRSAITRQVITLIELLSRANKVHPQGRRQYLEKRTQLLQSQTNLVEIDLLRAGEPMPAVGPSAPGDYRILISRGWQRPRAYLYSFVLAAPIPDFPVPLQLGEEEPIVPLNDILHALYTRARYDLGIDYDRAPTPPLRSDQSAWAQAVRKQVA